MKYCTGCGEKNSSEAIYCTNCGNSLKEIPTTSTAAVEYSPPTKSAIKEKSPKKMTKNQKIMFSIASVVILFIVVTHLILSNIYDPMKKIQEMNTAYNNQEKELFFNQFHVKEGTTATAENFYATVKNYGWPSLRENLTYEVEQLKNSNISNIVYNNGEFISVNSKPVLFGLYKEVEFSIIPIELFIYAPYKNMTITVGDKEIITETANERVSLGKFIEGEYPWSYTFESNHMLLSNEGYLSVLGNVVNEVEVDLEYDWTEVTIQSDLEDAIVFINGKSTEKTVSELNILYPVQLNSNVEVYAQTTDNDGNVFKSEVWPLEDMFIFLEFEHIRKEQEIAAHEQEVMNIYRNFRSDYAAAITYINFNYIDEYFKSGSTIKKDYAKFVNDHENIPGYYYDFLLNDVTSFHAISDTQFELQTLETFNYSSDSEGTINYERKKSYSISYEDGKYYINEIIDLDTKKQKIE
ncbi:hypothetical protein [Solibacillus sp. CAU 1738]|uniref:TcaA NTF2-like domain-containing protein n=1 Tax=Solibacillus sp. CAU 1738 TaxID=3140363 RepID=UPI003260D3ED